MCCPFAFKKFEEKNTLLGPFPCGKIPTNNLRLALPQPSPQVFSVRSDLNLTVGRDVTKRDSHLLIPRLCADNEARENAQGLGWLLPYTVAIKMSEISTHWKFVG